MILLVGRPARLDGSRSRHTGGRPIEFRWSIVSRPSVSRAEVVLEGDAQPEFIADRPGAYVFELVLSAGAGVRSQGGGQSVSDYYSDHDIKLFPAVPDGGLGVSRLDFFTRWPFTYESNGHWNDGCNCSPNTHLCPD